MAVGITTGAITVAATATQIVAAAATREFLIIDNVSGGEVFIGPIAVTAATGIRLLPGEKLIINEIDSKNGPTQAWYGIAASGVIPDPGHQVRYLQTLDT